MAVLLPKSHKRVRAQQLNVVNHSRDGRISDLFDHFRKDPYGHPDDIYANLKPVGADKPLLEWLLFIPKQQQIVCFEAFAKVLRKNLKLDKLKNGKQKWVDILIDGELLEKDDWYTSGSYNTMMTTLFGAFNRKIEHEKEKWKSKNINAAELPEHFKTINHFDVVYPEYVKVRENMKNMSEWYENHNPSHERKAKPMSIESMCFFFIFYLIFHRKYK